MIEALESVKNLPADYCSVAKATDTIELDLLNGKGNQMDLFWTFNVACIFLQWLCFCKVLL